MNPLAEISSFTHALSDPTRIRVWMLLQNEEVCGCHIVTVLKLAASTVSEHLAHLKKVGLIGSRKEGRWVYYTASVSSSFGEEASRLLREALNQDPVVQDDQKTLKLVLGGPSC